MGFLPTHRDRRVFVSWWKYTSRPDSFARAMGAENYFFAQGNKLWHFKYIPRALCCFWTLVKRRPRLVFASNPPPFSPLIVWLYCLLFRAKFCMDSHTSAFDRPRWLFFTPLHAFLARRAIWEATTNDELSNRMIARGSTAVTVPDIPFEMPQGTYPVKPDCFTVAFICSFDVDEPILEVMEAARNLPDVHFYVTGNPAKASAELQAARPENVTFTGFLSNEEYSGLLRSVSAIMVLTTFDFTMQRGGSEAITVGKPLITSDFPVLRKVFYKGTIHVDNTPGSIREAVEFLEAELDRYICEMAELQDEREQQWKALCADLETRISSALPE